MLMKNLIWIGALTGLTACAQIENNCTYETTDGYAHVVSVPNQVIVSINAKYPNAKLAPNAFPDDVEPAQVYKVKIKELTSGTCAPVEFDIGERVK
ncbi:hypothetical protein [Terasakiella sp. SH-1]|uniref:hypothetical protein n=1 Tax=Terasakiella sp. SH-1 TaxID=2560057 RepID=UPI0010735264|nr:hypothetical protein [Terasakiella sp. SH-1]